MSLCCICLLCKNTTDATERTLNELPPLHEVEQLNQPGENTFAWVVVREKEKPRNPHKEFTLAFIAFQDCSRT